MRLSTEQLLQTKGNQTCAVPEESKWVLGTGCVEQDRTKLFGASVKCFDIRNRVKTCSASTVSVNLCNITKCLQVLRVVTACLDPHLWPRLWLYSVRAHSLVGIHPPSLESQPRPLLTDSVQSRACFAAQGIHLAVAFSWLALNP